MPHEPDCVATGAEQLGLAPPLAPVQVHVHGPAPLTVVAVPALHRLAVGAELTAVPLALPQAPLTICGAEQVGDEFPPARPLHVQL